jgi:6-pyruvoyltetrahydropterin/6-carboxytetrahydropterin synthase
MKEVFEIVCETRFRAAHGLRNYQGGEEPRHEHEWRAAVTVRGGIPDAAGVSCDFLLLKEALESETARLEGRFLNTEIEEFTPVPPGQISPRKELSPSAENVARVLYRRLAMRLPRGTRILAVQIWEASGCSVVYRIE